MVKLHHFVHKDNKAMSEYNRNSMVRTNSLKAWVLAARPKTLTGAVTPVAIALALAWHDNSDAFQWIPAVLCLLFAGVMQIDANLVNDYYDCIRGIDGEDRLGPERACAQGWITTSAMKIGLIVVTAISAVIGLPLIYWGGLEMIAVGAACILFCFLYTTLLSGKAMGDVLVLIFFGLVPVCATYYLQTGNVTAETVMLAIGSGLAIDNLLIVNNYRDIDTDKKHGKITLITLIGKKAARVLYFVFGATACNLAWLAVLCQHEWRLGKIVGCLMLAGYLAMVIANLFKLQQLSGKALNMVLGKTALSILIYGISVCFAILL